MKLPVSSALLVNRTAGEVRVALVEDGLPSAFHVERDRDRGVVGNVYKGRVVRVVPGMQSAFVDIGLDRAAFLYVGDVALPQEAEGGAVSPEVSRDLGFQVLSPRAEEPTIIDDLALTRADGDQPADLDDAPWPDIEIAGPPIAGDPRDPEVTLRPVPQGPQRRARPRIEKVLRTGQEVLVQASKEAFGTKGARLTTHVAIPGRFLVFMPGAGNVGVSRRITDASERERLRRLVEGLRGPGEGFIVRTVCEGRSDEVLTSDVGFLREIWAGIDRTARFSAAPCLLHSELSLALRATRDLFSPDVGRLLVDDPRDFEQVGSFIRRFMPALLDRLELYRESAPLFEAAGVERQLGRALARTVRLPSGGYIAIDHTEALTAIDVNSGRFVDGRDLEETSLRVNLEAASVVVEQLRLRDIGGLIVIDFIDMEDPESRRKVEAALAQGLQADPARSSVLPISEFGLVEMTRRRVRDDLAHNLLAACDLCRGAGQLKSVATVAYEILREVARNAFGKGEGVRDLVVRCEPSVAHHLETLERAPLDDLGRRLGAPVRFAPEPRFHRERFAVSFQVRTGSKP